ncbi:MAG: alpha-glucosidase/alpha-galactosidase [Clostridia bacterium]|nr:alpha-glucosidase/alpha-galactosidase [Clostridia bacterium]
MKYKGSKVEGIKIAYIGGGSRGWARSLMSDLAVADDISGDVYLYDIDYDAAKNNEIIGNKFDSLADTRSSWRYHAVRTAREAYENADFVVISILPGTFDEMASDVHTPEEYGIYQSVGDTTGPGGIVRAMRAVPMFEEIGEAVKRYCPDAWVINYTNPMTICVKTLYRVFPKIKAFGCCHEVFQTQELLAEALDHVCGIKNVARRDVKINPISVNHFTWLTSAKYRDVDVFPVYREFAEKNKSSYVLEHSDIKINNAFANANMVKFDLFLKHGYIAAAGDRHLAEFCDGRTYLKDPETVSRWGFGLTSVDWRKEDLAEKEEKTARLVSGEEELSISTSGEEGVNQIRALIGLEDLVTNANIPNEGQIPNLPIGAVVETNAVFRDGTLTPVMAGDIPCAIYEQVRGICERQERLDAAIAARDVDAVFDVFADDPLVTCTREEAKQLFRKMVMNTKDYLTSYDLSKL